jgi:hypothetical protein
MVRRTNREPRNVLEPGVQNTYLLTMESALTVLIPIVVGATLLILIGGVISMLRGGNFNARNSNRLMRLRVLSQLVAVLLIGAFFLIAKH